MSVPSINQPHTRHGSLASKLQQYARESREESLFNDFIVNVGEECIHANRMVLACHSKYFERMFKINMKEKYSRTVEVEKEQGTAVKAIIDYFYSESIEISYETVMGLLSASDYLQVDEVKEFCFDFLKSILSTENSISVLSAVNLYGESTLTDQIYRFICENLETVSQTNEFKSLPIPDFISCLTNLNQYQTKTSSIYLSLITWIKHDNERRQEEFARLFEQVLDLNKLPIEFIEEVLLNENLITSSPSCYKRVRDTLSKLSKAKLAPSPFKSDTDFFSNTNLSKIISLGGHRTRREVKDVFRLDKLPLLTYPDLPIKVHSHCSLKLNDTLFCIGGETSQSISAKKPTNAVWKLNLCDSKSNWKKADPMKEKRCYLAAAIHQNGLVAVRGYTGKKKVNLTEFYQVDLDQWKVISSMKQPRRELALVSCEGYLYALGGYGKAGPASSTGRSRDLDGDWNVAKPILPPSSSVERLRVLDGEWESVEPMQTRRCEFAAVNCQDIIYVIGGRSHRSPASTLKSVEIYKSASDSWSYVKEMNIERSGHSGCVL